MKFMVDIDSITKNPGFAPILKQTLLI